MVMLVYQRVNMGHLNVIEVAVDITFVYFCGVSSLRFLASGCFVIG